MKECQITHAIYVTGIVIYDHIIRIIDNVERSPFDDLPELPHDGLALEASKIVEIFAHFDSIMEQSLIFNLESEGLR